MSLEMAPISWSLGDVKYKTRVERWGRSCRILSSPACRLPSHASLLLLSMQGEEIESARKTSRACEENVRRFKFHFSNSPWLRKLLEALILAFLIWAHLNVNGRLL